MHERSGPISPRLVDTTLAVAVAGAMALTVSVAEEQGARSPDLLAYLLGIAVGALLLARRRFPLMMLIGSVGALFVYYGLDYPAFSPAVPLTVAAYSAVRAGHLVATALLLTGIVLFGVGWQTLAEDTSLALVVGTNTVADAALLAAVVSLAEVVRTRHALADEARQRVVRAEADREREASRRVEQDRLRLAREVHDVLAHTIAAINVQAGAAAEVLEAGPKEARSSLLAIREESRRAMAELKVTVGLLREGSRVAPRTPAPGLSELGRLTDMASRAGIEVRTSVTGQSRPLPTSVDVTAYRIVQESLTNVVRHSQASSATVGLRYGAHSIRVLVEDDGRGPDAVPEDAGHGLIGMRERAAALGGTLEAGPTARGGYRIVAELPLAS